MGYGGGGGKMANACETRLDFHMVPNKILIYKLLQGHTSET